MKRWICKAFQIRDDEFGKVIFGFLIFFLVMSGIILGRNARDSIFLSNVDIKYLPYMYVVNAVFVVICSFVYSFFVDRIERTKFVVIVFSIFLLFVVLCKVSLLTTDPFFIQVFSVTSYVIVQIIWLVSLMLFWTLIGDYFDTRQSKRLFPLIGVGGLVGMIVAGLGAKPIIVVAGGTDNLFLLWAVLLGITVVLVILMRMKYFDKTKTKPQAVKKAAETEKKNELKESFDYLSKSGLLKNMALITLCLWVVFTIVDYEFNRVMKETFVGKDDLTTAIGIFRGIAGFVSLLVQFLLTQKIISKLGVARAVILHPAFLSAATLAMGIKFNFWTANIAKFGDHVLLYTVQDSSYQMLYNPIPLEIRGKARALVEGYIKPASMCLAGIILVILAPLLSNQAISFIAFGFALVWATLSFMTKKGYVESLVNNLKNKETSGGASAIGELRRLSDADNLDVLRKVLKGENVSGIAFALEAAESMKLTAFRDDIAELLKRDNPEIQAKALKTLGSFRMKELFDVFRKYLDHSDSKLQAISINALSRIIDEDEWTMFSRYAESGKLEVKAEALISIINLGGIDGILTVAEKLKSMLYSDDAENKKTACEIISRIRIRYFLPELTRLLNKADESDEVKLSVVKAIAKIRDAKTFDILVGLLPDKRYTRIARRGLKQFDAEYIREFTEYLKNSTDPAIRREIVRILDMNKKIDIFKELMKYIQDDDSVIRSVIIEALSKRFRKEKANVRFAEEMLDFIKNEVGFMNKNLYGVYLMQTLEKPEATEMLETSIREENDYAIKRIFTALGMIGDRAIVQGIYRNLMSSDVKLQALALETLENVGIKEVTMMLTPLFDDRPLKERVTTMGFRTTSKQYLSELIDGASRWLQSVTIYTIGRLKDKEFAEKIKGFLNDKDALTLENAQYATRALMEEKA